MLRDFGAGNPANITFQNVPPAHVGRAIEVHLTVLLSGRSDFQVAFYRRNQIPAGDFSLSMGSVIDSGSRYRVEFYIDENGDFLFNVGEPAFFVDTDAADIAVPIDVNTATPTDTIF